MTIKSARQGVVWNGDKCFRVKCTCAVRGQYYQTLIKDVLRCKIPLISVLVVLSPGSVEERVEGKEIQNATLFLIQF